MLVERSSYPHTNMKYIKIFIFFIYSFLFICLYISDAKIVILFLLLGLLYNYLAFGISERYDRLNRPILYNINSDKINIVYYNKKAKNLHLILLKR